MHLWQPCHGGTSLTDLENAPERNQSPYISRSSRILQVLENVQKSKNLVLDTMHSKKPVMMTYVEQPEICVLPGPAVPILHAESERLRQAWLFEKSKHVCKT